MSTSRHSGHRESVQIDRDVVAKSLADTKVVHLERLVDELIKERPKETQIQMYMEAAGLAYEVDPIARMNMVLAALNGAQVSNRKKKEKADEHGHGI